MKHAFLWWVSSLLLCACLTTGFTQSALNTFVFASKQKKTLPGHTPERGSNGKIKPEDRLERLGLLSLFYQNACYTSGKYNHNNFVVEQGTVKVGKRAFDAYKIFEPRHKAQKFLASQHCIAYDFPKKQNYAIYQLQGSKISKLATVQASDITLGKVTKISSIKISRIKGHEIYFFVPGNLQISSFQQLSRGVEGAKIKSTSLGEVFKYRFGVKAKVFNTSNSYTKKRQFFLLKSKQRKVGMIWQDQKTKAIFYTQFAANFKNQTTTRLLNRTKADLLAATNDPQGNLYYFTYKGPKGNTTVALHKSNASGRFLKFKNYSTFKKGLNIYHFRNYMAALKYTQGKIALMIGRKMHKSGDGLNHQGGIGVVFDANSLALLRNIGQTSGHSFDNYLTVNKKGKFLAIDLGDNYPRGINLHRFDAQGRRSRVVYTFKTEHGTRAVSPAGRKYDFYAEISRGGKKYYKWSNDNGTYSELGSVIEGNDGYIVLFTGEPSPAGKALDNSRAGYKSTDSRNIGFVKVRKDFEKSSAKGCYITDDLVLSRGINETGGFYTFGGYFSKQRNAGVKWLTRYRNKSQASARHLKAAKLSNGQMVLVWETIAKKGYKESYLNTFAMKIDQNGKVLVAPVALGSHVRLGRRDDILVLGNQLIIPSGNDTEAKLELVVIQVK